jgi:hypothetical protein
MRSSVCLAIVVLAAACNRAGFRIPGASTDFPETFSGYRAVHPAREPVTLAPAIDSRRAHYGERVAGTGWRACSTDSFGESGARVVEDRLAAELERSGVFTEIRRARPPAEGLVLRTDVRAFCAQAVGFFWVRVAGLTALDVSLVRGDRVVWTKRLERVVTDGDPEYSGSQVGTIEQAMRRTMADSLRVVSLDLLRSLDGLEVAAMAQGDVAPAAITPPPR